MNIHKFPLLYLLLIQYCWGKRWGSPNKNSGKEDLDNYVVSGIGGLRWRDLSVSPLHRKKGVEDSSYLLEPSSGFIQNGHITAIIGPSGSGKSTFLRALSGTTPKGSKSVSGSVWFDDSKGQKSTLSIS